MSEDHRFEVRIYYEDTDFSGNVYYAAYLKFMERARTELLRKNGIHHFELAKEGMAFAVRNMEISYERSAHIDDILIVETTIEKLAGARMILQQIIYRDGETLVSAKVTIAAISLAGKPKRLPRDLVENLS